MDLRSLLLSQDDQTVQVLTRLLAELGIGMEHCVDSRAALEMLARRKFDGVFADCAMEGAAELLKGVRRSRANKRSISFAILTDEMSVRSAFQLGANFVFYKPLTGARAKRSLRAAHGLMMRERRRNFRHPMDSRVHLTFEGKGEQQATIIDLSTGGMALKAPEPLAISHRVHVRFSLPEGAGTIESDGEVTWVDAYGRAGIHFIDMEEKAYGKLEAWLLARANEGDEGNGRSGQQVDVVPAEVDERENKREVRSRGIFRGHAEGRMTVVLIRSGKVIVLHGRCEDLSEEGLGGDMDGEMLLGDKVLIELSLSAFEEPLKVHAEVRHRSNRYYGFSFVALDAVQRRIIRRTTEGLPVRA